MHWMSWESNHQSSTHSNHSTSSATATHHGVYQFILDSFAHVMCVTAKSTFHSTNMLLHYCIKCSHKLHLFDKLPLSSLFNVSVVPLKAMFLSAKDLIIATNLVRTSCHLFLQLIQYKTLHRIHIAEYKMYKRGLANTDTCSQYTISTPDNYFHTLWACQLVYSF